MIKINGKYKESRVAVDPLNDNFANGVGAYHLSNTPELYEVQRDNNFMFELNLTDNGLLPLYRAGIDPTTEGNLAYSKFGNPDEVVQISVSKASIPSYTQNVITVDRGNTAIRYAGKISFDESFTLGLYDFIGAEAKDILVAWQALSGNPYTERVGHASDYKKMAFLCEYTPDYQLVRRWKLVGCWVSKLTFGEYKYDGNNDKVEIEATIVYDRAYIDTAGFAE